LEATQTKIPDVLIIEPDVYKDQRGFFMETYNEKRYHELGIDVRFVQDNLSFSIQNTLRGLHYQYPNAQAKLVSVIHGEVFDVVVDIRQGSPTFGKWTGARLSGDNKRQLFAPVGFAHGYCVLSETAIFQYKCSNFYSPKDEKGILWNDPDLNITWLVTSPLLSDKDKENPSLSNVTQESLPAYEHQVQSPPY